MFSISRQVDYAVQFLLELATLLPGQHLSVKQFSLRRNLSFLFLQKIVRRLKQAGLITATYGAGGGYTLAYSNDSITLYQIMEAVEGKFSAVSCFGEKKDCPAREVCLSRRVFGQIQSDVISVMKKYSLQEMSQL